MIIDKITSLPEGNKSQTMRQYSIDDSTLVVHSDLQIGARGI